MADINPPDSFDSHPESSVNDDFEKLDAPSSGDNGDTDGPNAADSGAYDYGFDGHNQDAEISTTTDNVGEDEAEEDRYAMGASEAEAHAQSSEPLVSLGDEEDQDDDPSPSSEQPSAPVPQNFQPLIDYDNSTDQDFNTFAPSAPPSSSHYPESIPFSSKARHIDDINERESSQVSSEKSSEGTSKVRVGPEESISKPTTPSDVKCQLIEEHENLFEQTAFYHYLVGMGSWLKGVDPRVKDLIYWRDVKKTGIVFGTMLAVLLSLSIFSLVSVLAYLSLAVLTVTFSFVVYKKIMGAVQKSNEQHPFKTMLDKNIDLEEEKVKPAIKNILKNVNGLTNNLRRLFLIDDIVDSIKFGLLLWAFTYIGSWFNGMSLIILALILIFTVPKVYETYQDQIDSYINLAKGHINNVLNTVQSKLPFLKKKEKSQ